MEKIRIVSATVHHDNNEVEIIIERTTDLGTLDETNTLHSVWINCEAKLAEKLEEI